MIRQVEIIEELRERYKNVYIEDKGEVFNSDLTQAIELGNMLDTALCMVTAGIARKESRGAHSRPYDYPDARRRELHAPLDRLLARRRPRAVDEGGAVHEVGARRSGRTDAAARPRSSSRSSRCRSASRPAAAARNPRRRRPRRATSAKEAVQAAAKKTADAGNHAHRSPRRDGDRERDGARRGHRRVRHAEPQGRAAPALRGGPDREHDGRRPRREQHLPPVAAVLAPAPGRQVVDQARRQEGGEGRRRRSLIPAVARSVRRRSTRSRTARRASRRSAPCTARGARRDACTARTAKADTGSATAARRLQRLGRQRRLHPPRAHECRRRVRLEARASSPRPPRSPASEIRLTSPCRPPRRLYETRTARSPDSEARPTPCKSH